VSPAKTAEPIQMLFEGHTGVGSKKLVLLGVHIGATWRIRVIDSCDGGESSWWHYYCPLANFRRRHPTQQQITIG